MSPDNCDKNPDTKTWNGVALRLIQTVTSLIEIVSTLDARIKRLEKAVSPVKSLQEEIAANKKAAPYNLVLYVLRDRPDTEQLPAKRSKAQSLAAIKLFDDAGITLPIKEIPPAYLVAYGAPVLFSTFGISCGTKAIARLLKNIGF